MDVACLFDLSGRVALVTGGNGGIGRSLALGLASAGASVAIVGRNEDKNARVLDELRAIGNPALALALAFAAPSSCAPPPAPPRPGNRAQPTRGPRR